MPSSCHSLGTHITSARHPLLQVLDDVQGCATGSCGLMESVQRQACKCESARWMVLEQSGPHSCAGRLLWWEEVLVAGEGQSAGMKDSS